MSAPPMPAAMRFGAGSASVRTPNAVRLRELSTWALAGAIVGYPVWWLLGFAWLVWPVTAALMLPTILMDARKLRLPPGFWIWMVLLAGCVLSAFELPDRHGLDGWLYHSWGYFAGAVILLYLFNMQDPIPVVLRYLTVLFCITVAGGVIGTLDPRLGFTSLAQHLLHQQDFFSTVAGVKFGTISPLFHSPRPSAPFVYANRWGAVFAITLPAAALLASRSGKRRLSYVITPFALVAVVYSLDRLLWFGLALAAIYLVSRLVRRGSLAVLPATLIGVVLVAFAILGTSLHGIAAAKLSDTASGITRANTYRGVFSGLKSSPLIGHGSTGARSVDGFKLTVPIGTQGLVWTLLYTGGLLQAVPFYSWFVMVLWKTRQAPSDTAAALRLGLGLGLALSLAYDLAADGVVLMMICAAALLREEIPDRSRPGASGAVNRPDPTRRTRARPPAVLGHDLASVATTASVERAR